MINNIILELYAERRELMSKLLFSLQDIDPDYDEVPGFTNNIDDLIVDRPDNINSMAAITERLYVLCDGDYLLLDMYRRLSLALSKENYEEATGIKNEILNHK